MFPVRLFRSITVLVFATAFSCTAELHAQTLSKEGQNQKAIHDYLFETFTEGRKTKFVGSGRDHGLKELTILTETREIRHNDELVLPKGTERIAGLFRHFAFHGQNLDRVQRQGSSHRSVLPG